MIQPRLTQPMMHSPQMSRHERLIICCVSLAAFTFQFEAFLINVALPSMAIDLHASSTEISFTVLTYLLATTITLLPAGKLSDLFGLRRTFLVGCSVAGIATLACGVSTSLSMLLVSRFFQGLGIGMIVANAYAMISVWIGRPQAGRGYGMLSLGAGLGMVVGLPVGGVLSYALSWHWLFLTTAPFFGGLFWLAYRVLPREHQCVTQDTNVDWLGLLAFGLMLSSAVLALSLGAELGWRSTTILTLFALTLILAGLLLARRNTQPTLFTPEIFKVSGLIPGLCVLFIFSLAVGGVRFLLPFHLQISCGLTPILSSILLLAYPISFAPAGVWAGHIADQAGSRRMVAGACLLVAILCSVFAWFFNQLGIWFFVLFVLSFGFANGMFFAPNNRFSMSNVPDALKGEASALLPVALNMGTLIGVSVFETVFTIHAPHGEMLVQNDIPQSEILLDFLNHGLIDALILAVSLLLIAALLAWLSYKSSAQTNNN